MEPIDEGNKNRLVKQKARQIYSSSQVKSFTTTDKNPRGLRGWACRFLSELHPLIPPYGLCITQTSVNTEAVSSNRKFLSIFFSEYFRVPNVLSQSITFSRIWIWFQIYSSWDQVLLSLICCYLNQWEINICITFYSSIIIRYSS